MVLNRTGKQRGTNYCNSDFEWRLNGDCRKFRNHNVKKNSINCAAKTGASRFPTQSNQFHKFPKNPDQT